MPRRPRVIIADDHPDVITAVMWLLEPHCEVISTAADGDTLMQQVGQSIPDVVVTDILMPQMNGLDACRHIRRMYPFINVVVITELADEDVIEYALQAGACAVISKRSMTAQLPRVVLTAGAIN